MRACSGVGMFMAPQSDVSTAACLAAGGVPASVGYAGYSHARFKFVDNEMLVVTKACHADSHDRHLLHLDFAALQIACWWHHSVHAIAVGGCRGGKHKAGSNA